MANNFNSVALIYDALAGMVFGKSIQKAQSVWLGSIPDNSKVLILGGGTGFILEELDRLELSLKVTYIEPSSSMMCQARKRLPLKFIEVDFIQDTHVAALGIGGFNVVITSFFLDVFTQGQLSKVVQQISSLVDEGGAWLLTDFVTTGIWWQNALIKLMYLFFKVTVGLEGNRLLNFEAYLSEAGYRSVKQKCFYYGMIRSDIYKRAEP